MNTSTNSYLVLTEYKMLTGLFQEEDESSGGASAPPEVKERISVERANPPRNETKLCGLANQGATCYLNALLQTLHFTPEFRQELFKLGAAEIGHCPADTIKVYLRVSICSLHLNN